jgi:hypothetical protein
MSIKTTHDVTREFALAAIMMKLYEASDSKLEDMLETALGNGFYNFNIVSQEDFDNNKNEEYPAPYLEDLNNLPEENNAY